MIVLFLFFVFMYIVNLVLVFCLSLVNFYDCFTVVFFLHALSKLFLNNLSSLDVTSSIIFMYYWYIYLFILCVFLANL